MCRTINSAKLHPFIHHKLMEGQTAAISLHFAACGSMLLMIRWLRWSHRISAQASSPSLEYRLVVSAGNDLLSTEFCALLPRASFIA
jgi:hypothetical protein